MITGVGISLKGEKELYDTEACLFLAAAEDVYVSKAGGPM
jgi:hypothetical protein